jgi:hypothetical protein
MFLSKQESVIMLHDDNDFQKNTTASTKDILDKISPPHSIDTLEQTVALAKFAHAVDLYKHEDNLNWHKLSHLFYVTMVLGSTIGLVISFNESTEPDLAIHTFIGMICLVGFVLSFTLSVSIHYGLKYLLARKNQSCQAEKALSRYPTVRVFPNSSETPNGRKYLVNSPTGMMLRVACGVVTSMWLIAGVLNIAFYIWL